MPADMPSDALIIQITDLHLPEMPQALYRGVSIARRLQQVLDEIKRRYGQPDLLLLTGDLTHHAGAEVYDWLAEQVRGVAKNCAWLPGNHDPVVHLQGPLWQQKLILAGWQILLLDSTAEADGRGSGAVATAELTRLQQQLVADPSPALVVLHHNPVATGSGWQDPIMLSNHRSFWHLLAGFSQVKAVLHGHIHHQLDTHYQGVQVMGTPSIAPQFLPQQAEFAIDQRPGFTGPALRWLKLSTVAGHQADIETGVVRLVSG
ncbi:MAG: metallophosphoesterase [Marinobacterium sp.]|nr:metallophosphoesterase [Marinobacterium sp.]